jgi:enolase-phosphatase E1
MAHGPGPQVHGAQIAAGPDLEGRVPVGLAQRLLFEHTVEGDLTPLIHAYFDTTTGPKQAAPSYRRIAEALRVAPAAVRFVSDVPAELDAAREAGMGTGLCVRADGAPPTSDHPVLRTFDEL